MRAFTTGLPQPLIWFAVLSIASVWGQSSEQGPLQTLDAMVQTATTQLAAGGPVNLQLAPGIFNVNQDLALDFTDIANPSVTIAGQGPNTVLDCGGRVTTIGFWNSTSVSLANLTVTNCASQSGSVGGVYIKTSQPGSQVTLQSITFTGNQAAAFGAALYVTQLTEASKTTVVLSNCTFARNVAQLAGGAAFFSEVNSVRVSGCTFTANSAPGGNGGGLHVAGGQSLEIVDSVFENNTAKSGGGAYLWTGAAATVENTVFVGNTASGSDAVGGGLLAYRPLRARSCRFSNNTSRQGGGLAFLWSSVSSPASVTDSLFQGNTAQSSGGNVWIGWDGTSPQVTSGPTTINTSEVNTSPATAPVTMGGCTLLRGTAQAGGGVLITNAKLAMYDTRLEGNNATRQCSAIQGNQLPQPVLVNNVTLIGNFGQDSLESNGCVQVVNGTLPPPGAPVSVLPPVPLPPQLQPPATLVRDATTSPSLAALSAPAPDNMPTAAVAGGAAAGGVLLIAVVGFAAWWFKHRTRRPQHGIGDTPTCSKANSGLEEAVSLQVAPADSMDKQGIAGTDMTTSASTQLPSTGTVGRSAKGTYRTSTLGSASSQTGGSSQLVAIANQPSAARSEDQAAYERAVLNRLQIQWSSIQLGKVLGAGGFGTVYKGMWKDLTVAVKMLSVDSLSSSARASLRQEALAMCELRHPAIAHIYGLVDDGEHCALVMKYYRHGALSTALSNAQYLGLEMVQRVRLALQVASGMSALHERGFIHGDLKTSNLLVELDGSVVITDFGLAVVSGERVTSGAMTVQISPPEVLSNPSAPRTKAGDVYAFGIVLLEIASGRFCYTGMPRDMIKRVVLAGQRPGIPPHLPPTIIEVIQACWAQEPEERPTFDHVMSQLVKVVRGGDSRPAAGGAGEHNNVQYNTLFDTTALAATTTTTTTAMWPFKE